MDYLLTVFYSLYSPVEHRFLFQKFLLNLGDLLVYYFCFFDSLLTSLSLHSFMHRVSASVGRETKRGRLNSGRKGIKSCHTILSRSRKLKIKRVFCAHVCLCAEERRKSRIRKTKPPPSASVALEILSEIQLAFTSYTLSLVTLAGTQV